MTVEAFPALFEVSSQTFALTIACIVGARYAVRCSRRRSPPNLCAFLACGLCGFYCLYGLTYWFNGIGGYNCSTFVAVTSSCLSVSNALTFVHLFILSEFLHKTNARWECLRWVGLFLTACNWGTLVVAQAMVSADVHVTGENEPRCVANMHVNAFCVKWAAQLLVKIFQTAVFLFPLQQRVDGRIVVRFRSGIYKSPADFRRSFHLPVWRSIIAASVSMAVTLVVAMLVSSKAAGRLESMPTFAVEVVDNAVNIISAFFAIYSNPHESRRSLRNHPRSFPQWPHPTFINRTCHPPAHFGSGGNGGKCARDEGGNDTYGRCNACDNGGAPRPDAPSHGSVGRRRGHGDTYSTGCDSHEEEMVTARPRSIQRPCMGPVKGLPSVLGISPDDIAPNRLAESPTSSPSLTDTSSALVAVDPATVSAAARDTAAHAEGVDQQAMSEDAAPSLDLLSPLSSGSGPISPNTWTSADSSSADSSPSSSAPENTVCCASPARTHSEADRQWGENDEKVSDAALSPASAGARSPANFDFAPQYQSSALARGRSRNAGHSATVRSKKARHDTIGNHCGLADADFGTSYAAHPTSTARIVGEDDVSAGTVREEARNANSHSNTATDAEDPSQASSSAAAAAAVLWPLPLTLRHGDKYSVPGSKFECAREKGTARGIVSTATAEVTITTKPKLERENSTAHSGRSRANLMLRSTRSSIGTYGEGGGFPVNALGTITMAMNTGATRPTSRVLSSSSGDCESVQAMSAFGAASWSSRGVKGDDKHTVFLPRPFDCPDHAENDLSADKGGCPTIAR